MSVNHGTTLLPADLRGRVDHEQRRAANPAASAWVSANAGSGKTKVLSDRVLRLLLAGNPPGKILCLTFTKAAAANMAIRVFDRLGRWVTLETDALAAELAALEGARPDAERLRFARRLFARAVETPGGLKIDTIHAFCERLLHQMPFEANVPARFAVLDEATAQALLDEVIAQILGRAGLPDDPLHAAWALVVATTAGETLDTLLRAIVRERSLFESETRPADAVRRLRRRLDIPEDASAADIERAMLEDGLPPSEWPAIAAALGEGSANDKKQADRLLQASAPSHPKTRLALYRALFFTADGPRKSLATGQVDKALKERLDAEQARLSTLDDALKGALAIERTEALFALGAAIRQGLDIEKGRVGALDFDDLIDKTLELLARGRGEAAWALYKLDRGIDHILIDEAQDTNPRQWEILRRITEDFTAGAGAAGARIRTIFAVGDPKQSIYGFQGAEPRRFEESRRHWRREVTAAALPFEDVPLIVSFRSAGAVLQAVDATFAVASHFRGLSFDDAAIGTVHETMRAGEPGLVEMWPVERAAATEDPVPWTLPVDAPERQAPPTMLAGRIARAVSAWTTSGDEWGRVWRPADILILVKKRSAAFFAVIRALKEAGVPVAGADRLDIAGHIAVRDLVAAGRAALLPQDDLTLATVLKSPLVGLDETDLMRLASGREPDESLVAALDRHARGGDAAARLGLDALEAWRGLARSHGPFGFYATLLGPLQGRRKLVARLGGEAGDAIDAFLCVARNAEHPDAPSLTAFLARFGSAAHEVKRDLDAGGDEVRVMTVHGAKGLEAGIVILIDGCQIFGPGSPLLPVGVDDDSQETIPIWSPGKKHDSQRMAKARELVALRALEEHNRLLYVAMTRARDRLVIAPYMTRGGETPAEAWCAMIRKGLVETTGGLVRHEAPYGVIDLWRVDGAAVTPHPPAADLLPVFADPDWLHAPVPPEPEPTPPIRPSGALAAADQPRRAGDGPFRREARLVGSLVHALLERLPEIATNRRLAAARTFIAARAPAWPEERRAAVVGQAFGVLAHEALAPLFGPGSRAEVPIVGSLATAAGARPVSGQIDRLAVTPDEVLIADFKTTSRPPRPEEPAQAEHVGQLALYGALVSEIHPGKRVRAFLVWTHGGVVRELGEAELGDALARIRTASAATPRGLPPG